jgi:hypothetical protein
VSPGVSLEVVTKVYSHIYLTYTYSHILYLLTYILKLYLLTHTILTHIFSYMCVLTYILENGGCASECVWGAGGTAGEAGRVFGGGGG